jgi:hypothetical protein
MKKAAIEKRIETPLCELFSSNCPSSIPSSVVTTSLQFPIGGSL